MLSRCAASLVGSQPLTAQRPAQLGPWCLVTATHGARPMSGLESASKPPISCVRVDSPIARAGRDAAAAATTVASANGGRPGPRICRRCAATPGRGSPSHRKYAGAASGSLPSPNLPADAHQQQRRRRLARMYHHEHRRRRQQQQQQQQPVASGAAWQEGTAAPGRRRHNAALDGEPKGGDPGGDASPPAPAFIMRSIRSWTEALQLLDMAGGPEGRPPSQLQLDLLLHSRLFRTTSGGRPAAAASLARHTLWLNRDGGNGPGGAASAGDSRADTSTAPELASRGSGSPAHAATAAAAAVPAAAVASHEDALWPWNQAPEDDDNDGGCEVASAHVLPSPLRAPRPSRQTASAVRGRPRRHSWLASAAAEDARWQADWELELEVQVQRHAQWLLKPGPSSLSPSLPPHGGASDGALLAAVRTSAAVMLPGHAAAATAGLWGAAPVAGARAGAGAGLNPHSPIPPMRTSGGGSTRALSPRPSPPPPPGRQQRELKGHSPSSPGLQPDQMQLQLLQPAVAAEDPLAGCGPGNGIRSDLALGGAAVAGSRCYDEDAASAAEVLLRIVYDAAVLQPEAWTNEQVAALLRRGAKLAYRYPGLLSAQHSRQLVEHHQPPMMVAASAPLVLPRPSSCRRNSAVSVSPVQPVVVGQRRTMSDALARLDAVRELDAGGGGGSSGRGAELRVRLQQLLLRVDGMLMTPRQEHPAAPLPAKHRWTSSIGGMAKTVPADNGCNTRAAVKEGAAGEAEGGGVASPPLSASAAVAAVWAAAALQLRLSPEGNIRRRILVEFRARRRRQPLLRQEQQQKQQQGKGKLDRQQPQQRVQGRAKAFGKQQQQKQRQQQDQPQPQRLGRLRLRKPMVGSWRPRLNASDVADVLWAFAVLGLQMSQLHLNRALRAVSELNLRSLVLRPTRLLAGGPVSGAHGSNDAAAAGPQSSGYAAGAATTTITANLPTTKLSSVSAASSPNPASVSCEFRSAAMGSAAAAVCTGASSSGDGGDPTGGGGMSRGGGDLRVRGLACLRPSQLTAVAWAAVELSEAMGREGYTAVWAAQLFASTQTRLSRLSPSQLVDLLWSIGRGRRRPTGPWRRAMAAAMRTAAPRMVAWQAARAAAALAKLRIPISYNVAAALLIALHDHLAAAQPSDVAAMVWALPYITRPYTDLFVRRHRRMLLDCAIFTQPALPSLEPPQLVQLVDGFARLRQLPGAEWMRLHREACIRFKSRFSEANRRKIRQAYANMLGL